MEKLKGFDFQALEFNNSGKPEGTGIADLAKFAQDNAVTDVILICHGFRNDAADARRLYGSFLDTLTQNMKHASLQAGLAGRKIAVGGAFWPSMVLPEKSEGSAQSAGATAKIQQRLEALKDGLKAPDKKRIDKMIALAAGAAKDEKAQLEMVKQLLGVISGITSKSSAEVTTAFKKAKPEMLRQALSLGGQVTVQKPKGGATTGIPTLGPATGGRGSAQGFFDSLGFVPKFVNLASFLLMFDRCALVGANGLAAAVRAIRAAAPGAKIHLVGHSLGGRAVTACAHALLKAPKVNVDTMTILQAAYSHFGLAPAGTSAQGVKHPRGFFRDLIEKKGVRGAIVATHSDQDSVVGFAYSSMAAVSGNNAAAFGDDKSQYGGIGRNGVLDTPEVVRQDLEKAGTAYRFDAAKITTLNGSVKDAGKARIQSHGDITNANVTWAFASLLASS